MMEQSWRRLATARMVVVLLGSLGCAELAAAEAIPRVEFDIPYTVACRDATTDEFREKNPERKLIEAQLEVSTLLREGKEDDLQQITVSLSSPRQRLRVEDFAPRTELHSDVQGEIKIVEKSEEIKTSDASLGGAISGDIGPVKAKISPTLGGVKTHKNATEGNFTKLPPKQVLVAAGDDPPGTRRGFQTETIDPGVAARTEAVSLHVCRPQELASRLPAGRVSSRGPATAPFLRAGRLR